MQKNSLAAVVMVALLAACSAAAQNADALALSGPEAQQPAAPAARAPATAAYDNSAVSCVVHARRTPRGLLIEGQAFADRDIDGEYDLVITKSGGGAAAEINQAGPLSIAAGSSVTLGESEIGLERGARIRAVLTLRDANGELCQRTFAL